MHGEVRSNDRITAKEAAKILKVETGTLANWRCHGVGPSFERVGSGPRGRISYDRDEVKLFAKAKRRKH